MPWIFDYLPAAKGFLRTRMTESPRKNILLINLSLLTGLAFFLPVKIQKIVIANNSNPLFIVLTFACLGHFGPHLLDTLQNHVAMPVKSFNSAEEFLVVSAIDQNLCVILDGLCQNWQRSCVEFFLLASFKLFWSHLRLGFIHNRGRHPGYFRQKSANVSDLRRIFVALFWYSTFPVFKYRI